MSESGSMLHHRNKNHCEKFLCRLHKMHSKNTTSLKYQLAFLASMWLAPMFTKQELTSGSRKWEHLPTIGIPKAIYHYMTNITKQQTTYQLFQNIMKPNSLLFVLPPSFCYNSASDLRPLKLGQWANQIGSRCHMTCKMVGNPWTPGGADADIGSWEGLAHFNVMQNRDNLYFPRAIHWIKNTFHVIL